MECSTIGRIQATYEKKRTVGARGKQDAQSCHRSSRPQNGARFCKAFWPVVCCLCFLLSPVSMLVAQDAEADATVIRRDAWGVAHIHGATHADAFFGMGYAQAEDYFWQLEDTCIRALGRYSEVAGPDGIRSDILNRSFEVARRSQADFDRLSSNYQNMAAAFADGINHYLKTHPKEKPRLLTKFEPWYVVAMDRHMILDFIYRQVHIGKPKDRTSPAFAAVTDRQSWNSWDLPAKSATGFDHEVRAAVGSNAWAVSGAKTESGKAMLFVNPHQPWYGMGQFYEAHIQSDEGLNFTGACFFGNPFPTIGHNEHLGWTYTVNEPDIADAWRITFDKPNAPLDYKYDSGYRTATQWQETLTVRHGDTLKQKAVTFRKTHHGPVVQREAGNQYLAVQVAGLFDLNRIDQAWGMVLADNFKDWKKAISHCAIPMFNVVYADDQNNIFYAYNGSVPIRNPEFNWKRPVDGSDPKTEWGGIHPFKDLPQLLNPDCGYVQSCNSTPFTTTHATNPDRKKYPSYMVEDADVDMRRAKMSRKILSEATDLTYEKWQQLAYDTRLYWAMTEIPKLATDYERLRSSNPELAKDVADFWQHLQDWDFRSTITSTQTTLTVAWYEELYGFGYPAETLRSQYRGDRTKWFEALKTAAAKVSGLYGTWKHPWGEAHRLQRVADQPDVKHAGVGLNPLFESLACPGAPGPLGIIFTVYSTPEIPFLRTQRFAVVGGSYMAVAEFGDKVQAHSTMPFGASGRRKSPHFFDQAKLYSTKKLKPAWFWKDEVRANSKVTLSFSR